MDIAISYSPAGEATHASGGNPELLLSPVWWKQLAPSLSVSGSPYKALAPLRLDEGAEVAIRQLIVREGYIQGSVGRWKLPIAEMVQVIERLKAAGLMPVFAFAYEEFWLLARQLGAVVGTLLDGQYYLLPDFWIWHVDPRKDESGWKPHRDKGRVALFEDGRPKAVTLWVPLTSATTLNGCMYVVPADRDPTYGKENEKERLFEYQDIRALPAEPGDFFVWNQAVMHWGSHASPRGATARVSVAFEFQKADVPPMNTPLITPGGAPAFHHRLNLIGKQVLQYAHMYPLSPQVRDIATAMARFTPREAS